MRSRLEEQFQEAGDFELPALDGPVEFMLVADDVKGVQADYFLPYLIIQIPRILYFIIQLYRTLKVIAHPCGGLLPDNAVLLLKIDEHQRSVVGGPYDIISSHPFSLVTQRIFPAWHEHGPPVLFKRPVEEPVAVLLWIFKDAAAGIDERCEGGDHGEDPA